MVIRHEKRRRKRLLYKECVLLVVFLMYSGVLQARTLRVCADPDNLPFSNHNGAGFENKIAALLSRDLDAQLEYVWLSERKPVKEDRCDLRMHVPVSDGSTAPYYRSTYVFVSRGLHVTSLTDERMAEWRIGINVVGNDLAPPAHALARRGLTANVKGYSLSPASEIVDAVARGEIHLAIVWGPLAGYFAKSLEVAPVSPSMFLAVPFTYEVALGARDDSLRAELNRVLARECAAIETILADYSVPLLPLERSHSACGASRQPDSASSR